MRTGNSRSRSLNLYDATNCFIIENCLDIVIISPSDVNDWNPTVFIGSVFFYLTNIIDCLLNTVFVLGTRKMKYFKFILS